MTIRTAFAFVALTACAVEDVETSPYAHESPPGPTLGFITYLGGAGPDEVLDLVGTTGSSPIVFAVGATGSTNFPTTDGSFVDGGATAGCSACPSDAFVARFVAPGRRAWSTAFGGPGYHRAAAAAIALDLDVFVGGSTSASLPHTAGTADPTFGGGATPERGLEDGFVCRLDGATGDIEWCTFVGGDGPGGVLGLALDPSGDGVIAVLTTGAGETFDAAYTTALAGRHRATPAGADTLVVRIAGDGSAFTWATYVGGTGDERGTPSVAHDGASVHVVTTTSSTDAPTPGGLSTAPAGVYYANLSLDGTTLRYATYLGGPGATVDARALAADGFAVVGLTTPNAGLPTTTNAFQPTFAGAGNGGCTTAGDGDGWIAVLTPTVTAAGSLRAATYLGRGNGERLGGIGLDRATDLVNITGRTHSTDFPTMATGFGDNLPGFLGAPCTSLAGSADAFLAQLPIDLTFLSYGTYLGGGAVDTATTAGAASWLRLAGGTTRSPDLRTFAPSQDTFGGGPSDGFVAVIGFWQLPPPTPGDAGIDGHADGDAQLGLDGGGNPGDGDGDAGCCGAAPDPASRTAAALLALATLALLARRRRRA